MEVLPRKCIGFGEIKEEIVCECLRKIFYFFEIDK